MRGLREILYSAFTAATVLFASCQAEYVPPTYPDVVVPKVIITGATAADTGEFAATDNGSVVQVFSVTVDAEGSIFPQSSVSDALIAISDDTNFEFTFLPNTTTFTVATKQVNESSAPITAVVTAMMSERYGGAISQLNITQSKANIPSFTTQPRDAAFGANVSQGSTATTTFVIDPASEGDIANSSFTVTESPYYYASVEAMSGVTNGYSVTFTATKAAVDAISSAGDAGLSVKCIVTLTYADGAAFEASQPFTVVLSK